MLSWLFSGILKDLKDYIRFYKNLFFSAIFFVFFGGVGGGGGALMEEKAWFLSNFYRRTPKILQKIMFLI